MSGVAPVVEIVRFEAGDLAERLEEFADVLRACVEAGAAVSFVLPFGAREARPFWRDQVLPGLERGDRVLLAALSDGHLVGTVQLLTMLPPNQPHRAEVTKLLVDPRHRRRGIGRRLMVALEAEARSLGKRLVTLDTRSDDVALSLYAGLGFTAAGEIPGFALNPDRGGLHATTYMYKAL